MTRFLLNLQNEDTQRTLFKTLPSLLPRPGMGCCPWQWTATVLTSNLSAPGYSSPYTSPLI